MAWRIAKQLVRAEIDNRVQGRVTGQLWFVGRDQPMTLDLKGNAWRDLAGHLIRIQNQAAVPGDLDGLADLQDGVVGDMTASRKVKVPDGSIKEFAREYKSPGSKGWHWANSLYLEWFSQCNGRVVIESVDYTLEVEGPAAWHMSDEEERAQGMANHEAMNGFMSRLAEVIEDHDVLLDEEADKPTSREEARADEDTARMNKLLDRIHVRMEEEGVEPEDFERIMEEEREKLRIERGA